MPRRQLPLEERQRRKNERLARWRANISHQTTLLQLPVQGQINPFVAIEYNPVSYSHSPELSPQHVSSDYSLSTDIVHVTTNTTRYPTLPQTQPAPHSANVAQNSLPLRSEILAYTLADLDLTSSNLSLARRHNNLEQVTDIGREETESLVIRQQSATESHSDFPQYRQSTTSVEDNAEALSLEDSSWLNTYTLPWLSSGELETTWKYRPNGDGFDRTYFEVSSSSNTDYSTFPEPIRPDQALSRQQTTSKQASGQEEDTTSLVSDPLGIDDIESVNSENSSSDLHAQHLEGDPNTITNRSLPSDNTHEELSLAAQLEQELQSQTESESDSFLSIQEIDLAAELAQHLMRFTSCPSALHQHYSQQCTASQAPNRSRHVTLSEHISCLQESNIPVVINQLGFFKSSERLQQEEPNWQKVFEGHEGQQNKDIGLEREKEDTVSSQTGSEQDSNPPQLRDNLCLECSKNDSCLPAVTFDIDSFLGFTRSLGFARQGLDINLFPRFHSNIQTDLHLYMVVYHDFGKGEKPLNVKLKKVPHYCAGRLLGHEDITFYIFFPRMFDLNKATNFPGKGNREKHYLLKTWTDSILIPAIFRHVSPTTRQHLPSSWDHARRKCQAYFSERSTRTTLDKAEEQVLSLHYTLHSSSLQAIWQDIEQQLQLPENAIYQDAQIFFSSKNSKLRYQNSTLSDVWEAFERSLSPAIDMSYLDRERVWLDLGKEVVGRDYTLSSQNIEADSAPSCYLFKTCCLENMAKWAETGELSKSVIATIYPTAMLRDASNLTLEMSRLSRKRREGWVYSQAYNSFKEITDAAKTIPFQNPYLKQLAWDPKVADMIQRQGGAVLIPNDQLCCHYQASKGRLFGALADANALSFGVREEHRISLSFFDQVRKKLEETGEWHEVLSITSSDSVYFRSLPTIDFLGYLGWNANKFMAAFEWILSLSENKRITYEHCKVMTMLIDMLPFAADSGPIQRRNELWKASFQRRNNGPYVLGMGLKETLDAHGYMWFQSRIDWQQLVFQPRISSRMAFTRSMLSNNYRKNWARVNNARDDLSRVEAAEQWLSQYRENKECVSIIQGFLAIHVIRAYRKEVFAHLKPLALDEQSERYQHALKGRIPLCWATLNELLRPESVANMTVVESNRTNIRTVESLVSLLWDLDNNNRTDRGNWANMAFRVLCQRAVEIVTKHLGAEESYLFHDSIKRYFIATSWMIPYPRPKQFFQKNNRKQTLWVAIFHLRLAYSKSKRDRVIPTSFLRETVKSKPTKYRSRQRPEAYKALYMPDWALSHGHKKPNEVMTQIPGEDDEIEDYLQPDVKLETISDLLEAKFRLSRSYTRSEED